MDILYAKRFNKDIDAIRNETKIKKRLLDLIGQIKKWIFCQTYQVLK